MNDERSDRSAKPAIPPAVTPAVAPSPQTLLGFDYGEKRVGVAVGNTLTHNARPLLTIAVTGEQRWQKIEAVIKEWQPDALVAGVPFHPDGAEHENTLRARKFARQLQGRYHLPVFEVDERYTTTSALEMGATGHAADAQAAAIILEQYLTSEQQQQVSPNRL